jgi:hypothetical protein
VTDTLKGELGSVKSTEAGSGVGLLISPASGNAFATLEGTCLSASPEAVEGSIAAEVPPTEEKGTVGGLNLVGSTGKQVIKEINVLGTIKKPSLSLGSLEASEAIGEELLFSKSVKVVGAAAPEIEVVKPEGDKVLELLINGGTKGVIEYRNKSAVAANWFPLRSKFTVQNNGFVEVPGTNRCVNQTIVVNGTCKVEVEFTLGMEGVENIFLTRVGAPEVDLKSIR